MRKILNGLVVALVVTLVSGPIFAAPLYSSTGATFAPARDASSSSRAGLVGLLMLGVSALGITIRKDTGTIASKYVTRASAASGDYKDGVSGAGPTWEANTQASEQNWEQGTQAAMNDKRFAKNVAGKSSKYQTNAVNLGSQRYAPGVANAKDAYTRGMQPVLDTLKALQLPPKGPRRSPQNQARSNAVGMALGAMKIGK